LNPEPGAGRGGCPDRSRRVTMSNETGIRDRFWKELKSERTIMLGLDGEPGGGMQPMTALVEDEDGGPLWIFTSKESDLARAIRRKATRTRSPRSRSERSFREAADVDPASADQLEQPRRRDLDRGVARAAGRIDDREIAQRDVEIDRQRRRQAEGADAAHDMA